VWLQIGANSSQRHGIDLCYLSGFSLREPLAEKSKRVGAHTFFIERSQPVVLPDTGNI
jgi:hypothetical protein